MNSPEEIPENDTLSVEVVERAAALCAAPALANVQLPICAIC